MRPSFSGGSTPFACIAAKRSSTGPSASSDRSLRTRLSGEDRCSESKRALGWLRGLRHAKIDSLLGEVQLELAILLVLRRDSRADLRTTNARSAASALISDRRRWSHESSPSAKTSACPAPNAEAPRVKTRSSSGRVAEMQWCWTDPLRRAERLLLRVGVVEHLAAGVNHEPGTAKADLIQETDKTGWFWARTIFAASP